MRKIKTVSLVVSMLAFVFYSEAKAEIGTVGASALNFFLPFGIGSWVQGDKIAGGIQVGFDSLGLILIGAGALAVSIGVLGLDDGDISTGTGLLIAGGILFGLRAIYGVIAPYPYAKKKRIQKRKKKSTGFKMDILPDGIHTLDAIHALVEPPSSGVKLQLGIDHRF